jgi:hypothetical protein
MSISVPILASLLLALGSNPPTSDEVNRKLDFNVCVVRKESPTEQDAKFVSEFAKKLSEKFTVVHIGTLGENESIRNCDGDDLYLSSLGIDEQQRRYSAWSGGDWTRDKGTLVGVKEFPFAEGLLRIPKAGVRKEFRSSGEGRLVSTQKGAIKNLANDICNWVDKYEENVQDALAKANAK